MATLPATHPTLLDVTRRLDPDGKIDTIVEMLVQTNAFLEDAVWIEGNLPTGHRTTVRTGLPVPTWRKLYGGVQPTKSTTAQVTDTCGMMEMYSEVDVALADLNNNAAAFRLSEDRAHMEGLNQELASTAFYGDEATAPEEFTGLHQRYLASGAANGDNMIDGGAAASQTDCTSIWLIAWGPQTCHMIYPKGSTGGLQMTDKGQVTVENATEYLAGSNSAFGGRYEAYRTHFRWDCGLTLRDWRYVVRIHSIDTGTWLPDRSAGANLPDLMAQAIELLPDMSLGRPVFYMNRPTRTMLRRQIEDKVSSSTLTMEQVGGKRVTMFDGIPVKRTDAITVTEDSDDIT